MSFVQDKEFEEAVKKELYILLQYLPKGRMFENFWIEGTNSNKLLKFYARVFAKVKYRIYKYFYDYLHIEEFIDSEKENSLIKEKLKDYFFYQNKDFYKIIRKETEDKEKINQKEVIKNLTVVRKYYKENTMQAIKKITEIYNYKIDDIEELTNDDGFINGIIFDIIRPSFKEGFTYNFPIFFNIKRDNELKLTNIINSLKHFGTRVEIKFKNKNLA